MKRFSDEEKKQIGLLIHYYRNQYFHSNNKSAEAYKQIEFCKNICSQTQLSRIENGDLIKDQEIYEMLMVKLNLSLDKISTKELMFYEAYVDNLLLYQNDDSLIINYKEYIGVINKYQNIFKKNIIYTHYNYALEFIITILNEDLEEASYLLENIEDNLDVLYPKLLILTIQYLGSYYQMINNNSKANKFYLLALEHMHKNNIKNPIIYLEIAYNYMSLGKYFNSLENLYIALNIFENSNNYAILEKIYRFYGIVYLKNRYYEDAIKYFNKAISFCMDKQSSLSINYVFISICNYFSGNYKNTIDYIDKAEKVQSTEKNKLLKTIYNYKISNKKEKVVFENKIYNKIVKLYYSDDDLEEYFEEYLKNMINKLSDDLKIVILRDVYYQYKEENKYKKALDHLEEYMIN
ncbi:MAG: hypothetical protein K0Q49_1386 [Haloplasmataceae bacterium]|jgi:tetratricopeptide (TPR) repeat protein|nr:hypothetical protein [Haloplasmataceae bacterium]